MDRRRRRNQALWDQDLSIPVHPIGRARRRWPRAYDGALRPDDVQPRYRRAYDGDTPPEERRRTRTRMSLDPLRQSPIRNGLIGLAVAGTAAPIAVNRYQQAMRTDPAHESLTETLTAAGATEGDVSEAWQGMETAENDASAQREASIKASIAEYSEYGLDRALAEQIYDSAVENNIEPNIAFGLVPRRVPSRIHRPAPWELLVSHS